MTLDETDVGLRIVFGLLLFGVVITYIIIEVVSWKRGK